MIVVSKNVITIHSSIFVCGSIFVFCLLSVVVFFGLGFEFPVRDTLRTRASSLLRSGFELLPVTSPKNNNTVVYIPQ